MRLKTKEIYTVSELTRNIRTLLESKFETVWVEGEVSNFVNHQSGHMYFSIRDKESVLSCVFFRSANSNLKFEIKNGMQILCLGKISVYDKRGQYQLYVNQVEPKGAGALQIAFEQLKEKLKKEKLFDEEYKKSIPYLPRRVGVITSPTGAAIKDILNVTERRFANIEIILNPTRVQGDEAKTEIVEALNTFNELDNVDVIILGRGGGSLEDLWPFNEEIVARAIYASKIPIISAVGHEIDWTISDFVSDKRAPTPSAAAELVIPRKEDLINKLNSFSDRIKNSLLSQVDFFGKRLEDIKERYVFKEPLNIITQHEQEIDELLQGLTRGTEVLLKFKNESLKTLSGKIHALSPLGILNRGYSITIAEDNKNVIKDSSDLEKGDIIKTRLAKGEVTSKVETISKS